VEYEAYKTKGHFEKLKLVMKEKDCEAEVTVLEFAETKHFATEKAPAVEEAPAAE